jgi:hypothetical protein
MTLMLAAVTIPINTVFGTMAALNITRNDFPGKLMLTSVLDLPFSISPVAAGEAPSCPPRTDGPCRHCLNLCCESTPRLHASSNGCNWPPMDVNLD